MLLKGKANAAYLIEKSSSKRIKKKKINLNNEINRNKSYNLYRINN